MPLLAVTARRYIITKELTKAPHEYPDAKSQPHVQVAKAIIGVVDWGLTAQQAIALPFLYSPGDTLLVEECTDLEAMLPAFRALGHEDARTMPGRLKANAVEWVDGQPIGAADPRSEGAMVTP